MQWRFKHSHGGDHSPVSTFAVLLLVALVAAGCVLWFMTVAMRNERLAVQQRLSDVYLNHLATVERELTTFWRERQMAVQSFTGNSASEIFAATIRSNLADSVILYDPSGTVAYPSAPNAKPGAPAEEPKGWEAARELEFQKTNYVAAAEAYRRLAKSNADIHLKARGMQAQGSCLLKAGLEKPALEVLAALTNDSELRNAISPQGSLLVPNAQLLVLKVIHDSSDPQFQQTLADLTRRLNDYSESEFSAGQRRFLMEEVNSLKSLPVEAQDSGRLNSGTAPRFPTLVAEALAAEYLELQPVFPAEFKLLRGIGIKVWRLATADRLKVVLFREDRVREEMNAFLAPLSLPEIRVALFAPGDVLPSNQPLPAQEAGELFPGWRLALQFQGVDPFLAASERQTRFHLWTGSLVVLIIAALAFLAARFVGAQMRLARVKNELVSTVSHELKTPLASMGVLVDTLLAGRYHGSEQLQKYLRLLAKENRRLSHLIENFLSFSRMERNKQPFRMENVAVSRI
ncbi:MAG: hypothetical protein O2960_25920, partial [Verrucomicrobia bacterium]|nr:hypothetical protein [Verrucomicrobiota bacterium]